METVKTKIILIWTNLWSQLVRWLGSESTALFVILIFGGVMGILALIVLLNKGKDIFKNLFFLGILGGVLAGFYYLYLRFI